MVNRSTRLEAARVFPAALLGLLLLVSVWWDGAFDLRYWTPLAILALALLGATVASGSFLLPRRGPLVVSVAALWAFAAYVMLTALWSDSAAGAWTEAARTTFYAALWTVGAGSAARGEWQSRLGAALLIGVGAVGLITLIGLVGDGQDQFLAGRLDSPIGYRNATAALFAIGVWPALGFAARRGASAGLRSGAFATAVLLLGLAFLTQSRGVLIGLVVGGAVSLAIGPDRIRRAWLAIGAVGVIAAASGALLTPYDAFVADTSLIVGSDDIHTAAVALGAAVGVSFVVGLFLAVFDNGLRSTALDRSFRALAVGGLVFVALAAGAVGLAKIGNPVSYADTKLDEFSDVEAPATTGSTRLGSVGGQRSDLWRIAWDEFKANPLAGGGAGSYPFEYYRERDTDRNLSDPHSLPFKVLAETGLIGALLFATWFVAAALAIARRARESIEQDRLWTAGLAAAGATVLAQCLTDWLWLLPGLLGLGILALGLAAGGEPAGHAEEAESRNAGGLPRIAAFATIAIATLGVIFLFLGNLYVRKARVEAYRSADAQLSAARTAAWFNPVSVTPLYLQASALESLGREEEAKRALEEALEEEPDNFVTLGLLGDFEVRQGDAAAARVYYRKALALNPKDIGLRELSEGER